MSARRPPVTASRARFERRASRVRRRPLRLALAGVLALGLLIGVGWLVGFSSVLATTSVQVEGVSDADASAVLDAAAVPLGTPLARLDTNRIAERVQSQVRFVKQASVHRAWPQTVVVEVAPRTALLALRGADGSLSLVDDHGVSFREVATLPEDLPVVGSNGTPAEDGLAVVVEVLGLLTDTQRSTVTDLTVSSADLVTFMLGKVQVVWGGRGDGAKKRAVLNALLKTDPAVVDVSAPDTPVTR
ncbi:MAG: FtsQ-type POTRA domain-containing protein [Dermatophilaceae bacterium]